MEHILLKALQRHVENEEEMIGDNQHGFTKGKYCLMNWVTFCDGVTAQVGKRRAIDGIYLGLWKVFKTVPHDILVPIFDLVGGVPVHYRGLGQNNL